MRCLSRRRSCSLTFKATAVLLTIYFLIAPSAYGQATLLDTLNDHLLGTWKGVNHDYMDGPMTTSSVTLLITRDNKPNQLKMSFTYVEDLGKKVSHEIFLLRIDPKTATFFRDRKKFGKDLYNIEGLDEVLRTGYGDFKLRGIVPDAYGNAAIYRADYHLSARAFRYEVYLGAVGKPFVKTGDWSMTRENPVP